MRTRKPPRVQILNEVSKPQRVRTSERMQGLGDVAREIAHGVHVHGWSAATLVVPTGELRRECSLQGRRMWPQASSNPPTPEVRRAGGYKGSILRALRAKRTLPRGCGQMRHVADAWVLFGGFTKQNEGFSRLGWF